MGGRSFLAALLAVPGGALAAPAVDAVAPGYFEGRWAFVDESCGAPTSWTMRADGQFMSQDLAGTWVWEDGHLILRLDDLAVDEESGEPGGRFRMEGPVTVLDPNRFDLMIEPEVYRLQRCR